LVSAPQLTENRPIEFATLLEEALAEEFRVLVCDEAQWLTRLSG